MNLDRLAERVWWPFWQPSWNSPSPATFFHPENDFAGFLDPKNLDKDTKFITPGQIQMDLFWV